MVYSPYYTGTASAVDMSPAFFQRIETFLAGAVEASPGAVPTNTRILYREGGGWNGSHTFAHGGTVDSFGFGAYGFTDSSGTNSPMTYSRFMSGEIYKSGQGTVDMYHGLVNHSGSGEAGLFIGQVTGGSGGGNLWGGHFKITTATTDPNIWGHVIEVERNTTPVGGKVVRGLSVQSVGTQRGENGVEVVGAGGWLNYMVLTDATGDQVLRVSGVDRDSGGTYLTTNSVFLGVSETLLMQGGSDLPRVWGGGTSKGILFYASQSGAGTSGSFLFRNNGGDDVTKAQIDTGTLPSGGTALRTRYHNGTSEQALAVVSVGAADSGGSGFRLLRVPN